MACKFNLQAMFINYFLFWENLALFLLQINRSIPF